MKNLVFVFVFLVAMGVCAQTAKPQFTLNNLDGKAVSLSDFGGKVVVIDFWATWCTACREAFPQLNKIKTDFGEKGVAVVGINLENMKPEKIGQFAKKANLTYTILLDPSGSTAKSFGIKGVPSLVVVNKDGTIAKMFRGMNKQTESEIVGLLKSLTKTE
jgi:cytochrome c biogenesis protein CcmG, thiol:disulfide interchange protein DsbE